MKNKKLILKTLDDSTKKLNKTKRELRNIKVKTSNGLKDYRKSVVTHSITGATIKANKILKQYSKPRKVKIPVFKFSKSLEKKTAEGLKEYREKKFEIQFINEWKYRFRGLMFHYIEFTKLRFDNLTMFDLVLFGIGVRFQWRK